MLRRTALLTAVAVALAVSDGLRGQEGILPDPRPSTPPRLTPTDHPPLPDDLSDYWLVPASDRAAADDALGRFARGVALIGKGDFGAALPLVSAPALAKTTLVSYAQYYKAVALAGLSRFEEADAALAAAMDRRPRGYLEEALPQRTAEVALARRDAKRAVKVLDELKGDAVLAPEAVLLQLGQAAERAGDVDRALDAYRRVYYDFATTPQAADAQDGIGRLETADRIQPDRYKRDRERAQKLFDARRWAQARAAFEPLLPLARGDDAELVSLRLAECDYYLDRFRAARDRLAPLLDKSPREAEARFFHLTATRALGDEATYERLARQLVDDHGDSSWADETLHNLASHFMARDDDAAADQVFRELLRRFPKSSHAQRAAWKVGWRAYRTGDFLDAATTFEWAAQTFPRADYRPAWLYWSARSRAQLNQPELATDRYRIVIADYDNSYYGRLAEAATAGRADFQRVTVALQRPAATADRPVPTDALIRELVALQLYDDALREVQYAQRKWGDAPALQATGAYIRFRQGLGLKAQERFNALRGAITAMRRAYPQFMASGGDQLPPDVLQIIFPVDYWPLISKYSKAHDLDPYLVTALMAQESTFTAEIKSSANAIGLMQLIPSTGRRYARQLGIRNFSTSSLMQPETNVRIGTQYFKELLDRFGGAHFALASYNAGENRVTRWIEERPGLPADEFIDDIPFPETQNYVKRILGTAEDYRLLYGSGLLDPNAPPALASAASAPAPRVTPAAQPKPKAAKPPARRSAPARSRRR